MRRQRRFRSPFFFSPPPHPPHTTALRTDCIAYLASCAHPTGGYGGSPGAPPHLAPTYAAVAALTTLGGDDALASIDAPATLAFITRCAVPPDAPDAPAGGFRVCKGGEADVRGCYTAAAVVTLLGGDVSALATRGRLAPALAAAVAPEGGLGGAPHNESHGGYAFCGAAAAALCGLLGGGDDGTTSPPPLDARRVALWAGQLQSPSVGGFAGRTSKLVDGCYSFWVGGLWGVLAPTGALPPPGAAAGLAPRSLPPGAAPPLPLPPPLPAGGVPGPLERALVAADDAAARAASDADATPAAEEAALAADVASVGEALLGCPPGVDATPLTASFDPAALQHWILACCQAPAGGLRDKPGKPPDLYHTCYCLSGLSVAQAAGGSVVGGGGEPGGECASVVERDG